MINPFSLTLRNDTSEIVRLVDRIDAFGAEAGLPPDVTYRLALSLDEIVSNVIRHGLDDNAARQILVTLAVDDGHVTATVVDDGVAFDPRDVPLPDLDAPLEERQSGGLGMHLVQRRWTRSTTGGRTVATC